MRLMTKDTKENSKELRVQAMQEIDARPVNTLQDEMVKRMYDWWGNWVPDYEGWLKLADSLYAPEAIINAIGDTFNMNPLVFIPLIVIIIVCIGKA